MNAVTSSSTGAIQRSGQAKAPASVTWLASSYRRSVTGTPAASSRCAICTLLRCGLTSLSSRAAPMKAGGEAAPAKPIGCVCGG